MVWMYNCLYKNIHIHLLLLFDECFSFDCYYYLFSKRKSGYNANCITFYKIAKVLAIFHTKVFCNFMREAFYHFSTSIYLVFWQKNYTIRIRFFVVLYIWVWAEETKPKVLDCFIATFLHWDTETLWF